MIDFQRVSKSFGEKRVLQNFSISLPERGAFAVLGPSGCGKTTFLRLAAGLEKPDSGRVLRPPYARCAFCFQEDRLLPWRTIGENVALVSAELARDEAETRARRWLARVELSDEWDAYPAQLSGGMKRRAALARCLSFPAPILMLDEPFRALDEKTHARMRKLVLESAKDRLLVLVTHDERDAEGMEIIRF